MRVLVCGDRRWTDKGAILRELEAYDKDTVIIEGEARGADTLAREVAESLGMTVEAYAANWPRYGRAAGSIRNQAMLDSGQPDIVLAFHADIDNSKGTRDMVIRAKKAMLPVRIFSA